MPNPPSEHAAAPGEVQVVNDWRGRPVEMVASRGGVLAVCDFADNLIKAGSPWPPPAIVQKLYESRQASSFDEPGRSALEKKLGIYSDLQSINSEDAITWSFFGPLMVGEESSRAALADWLLERAGIARPRATEHARIDLWRRLPHPDKSLPGGPELDAILDADSCVVFFEAKWLSNQGERQGLLKDKSQMQLRREFLEKYGTRIWGERTFLVVGVSLVGDVDRAARRDGPAQASVPTLELRWSDLADFSSHPCGDEFSAYLEWKQARSPKARRLLGQ